MVELPPATPPPARWFDSGTWPWLRWFMSALVLGLMTATTAYIGLRITGAQTAHEIQQRPTKDEVKAMIAQERGRAEKLASELAKQLIGLTRQVNSLAHTVAEQRGGTVEYRRQVTETLRDLRTEMRWQRRNRR